ncbi:MAG: hypothetical protein LBG69_06460 [Zoogloeaceae bacterium]|jgi:antitoxin component YwqK of YwqJK toxin-antitoxin module|nr:hypothetical protein [Zoogloeaceae bacterium]
MILFYKGDTVENKEYNEDGKLIKNLRYSYSKKTGARIEYKYHSNGTLASEYPYEFSGRISENGLVSGIAKIYYENGVLQDESSYKKWYRDGFQRTYYENGKLESEAFYKNNALDGVRKTYNKNGQLESEESYKAADTSDRIYNGPSRYYYQNGKLRLEILYENNKQISYKSYDEDGILIYEK